MNPLIKLNKIRNPIKANRVKFKTKRFNDLKRKKAERKRKRRNEIEQRRLQDSRSMERRKVKRMFPNEIMKKVVVGSVPKDMKDRFFGWCASRGYTPAGRIRKFMFDCVSGVIQE